MIAWHVLQCFSQCIVASQFPIGGEYGEHKSTAASPDLAFSEEWQVLGPFQIGTREAVWGADPLEYHGGFRALEYNTSSSFRSSLAFNGTVTWSKSWAKVVHSSAVHVNAQLGVSFPEIDWGFLQQIYGWAALQWQGWARGQIIVRSKESKTVTFNAKQVLEFWIDNEHYFGGDFYSFGRAPLTLYLEPGVHNIDVRLVRDVRAMGGFGMPSVDITLALDVSRNALHPLENPLEPLIDVIVADVVDSGKDIFSSPYASITVRNDALSDIHITRMEERHHKCKVDLVSAKPVRLVPGQTRPLPFRFGCVSPASEHGTVEIDVVYVLDGETGAEKKVPIQAWPQKRSIYEPHKITYLHPGGIVSYAILRPPSKHANCVVTGNESLPILLLLHGAGVNADSDMMRHILDPVPDLCAWALLPSGVTAWSGDDWHQWGLADVEAAIAAIPDWIEWNGWKGPGVDINRWLVSGHSNGGQGAWYIATHRPDKVIAAAPLSGYSSIQNYVPYTFWHPADPGRMSVIHSVLNSYRHELLLDNIKDIPTFLQHGSADDNVPAYHSRLMAMQAQEAEASATFVEMAGKPHYWDGVMTTQALAAFYAQHLTISAPETTPHVFEEFGVVSANFGDQGPRNGIEILELLTPGQLGKVEVSFNPLVMGGCILRTSNILSFRVPLLFSECAVMGIDGQAVTTSWDDHDHMTLTLKDGRWVLQSQYRDSEGYFPPMPPRMAANQLGPLDAILRTRGIPTIVVLSKAAQKAALQISRNLYQYYAADSVISDDYDQAINQWGNNIISVAIGSNLPTGIEAYFHAIKIFSDHVEIVGLDHKQHYYGSGSGLAAIFLRPVQGRRLELVVWGVDVESLDIAARLVPLMAGSGQPDFVIADRSMSWKGVEGAVALGFLDSQWNVTRTSYLT